jgi:hypothetical protein
LYTKESYHALTKSNDKEYFNEEDFDNEVKKESKKKESKIKVKKVNYTENNEKNKLKKFININKYINKHKNNIQKYKKHGGNANDIELEKLYYTKYIKYKLKYLKLHP